MDELCAAMLALADEAQASGLTGAAASLRLTGSFLRLGVKSRARAEIADLLRSFAADDRARANVRGETFFAKRSDLYEQAIALLVPPAVPAITEAP